MKRHTCEATEESRDQWRRNQDLPQFSNQNNRCLHCAGAHQTRDCATTRQWQTPTTNNPASGTGISMNNHTHNTPHYTSSQSNTQLPASHQHSQSTMHVQTPTLRINAPHFQPNLQPPPMKFQFDLHNSHSQISINHQFLFKFCFKFCVPVFASSF